MSAVIEGLGGWLPPRLVTNDELSRRLDTTDAWIESRTGIRQRHVADGVSTGEMAVHAAARALASAGRTDVDLLVLATTTPDRPCPATAPEVASALGLAGIPAFDISAVCTGFLYALATAAGFLSTPGVDRVLVVASEAFSTILDPADRGTVPIFGDGAGAVVLRRGEPDEVGALGDFVLGSDGKLADLITVRGGGAAERTGALTANPADRFFQMRGREVFADAVMRMTGAAADAMKLAGWNPTEVDWFIGHQANLRILHAVAEQLELPLERLIVHLDQVGNTAAASIPLALAHGQLSGRLQPGQRIVLAAFGGGATWGATTLCWPALRPIDRIT